jgi:hypothetical protein
MESKALALGKMESKALALGKMESKALALGKQVCAVAKNSNVHLRLLWHSQKICLNN